MVVCGTLIGESLRVGSAIDGIAITMTKIARARLGDAEAEQPDVWTFIEFEAADEDVERLVVTLEGSLERVGGWYCDFRSDTETVVVFSGRTFRYRRGDSSGRAAAADCGRAVGVPEEQLDWPV